MRYKKEGFPLTIMQAIFLSEINCKEVFESMCFNGMLYAFWSKHYYTYNYIKNYRNDMYVECNSSAEKIKTNCAKNEKTFKRCILTVDQKETSQTLSQAKKASELFRGLNSTSDTDFDLEFEI